MDWKRDDESRYGDKTLGRWCAITNRGDPCGDPVPYVDNSDVANLDMWGGLFTLPPVDVITKGTRLIHCTVDMLPQYKKFPRPKSTVAFLLYSLVYKPVYMTQRRYRMDDTSHTP